MATAQLPRIRSRWARSPFYFNSAAHLLRIGRERARNLGEMLECLRNVSDESIFQHTFQTLQEHHFIREGFSNDFAHWAYADCNEIALAERLAGVDVRSFTSLPSLRQQLIAIVESYLQENPRARDRNALEAFYFCSSDTVVIPTPFVARNMFEFAQGLEKVSIYSIHYHFIEARLRLKLTSNDFSMWMEHEMELPQVAKSMNRIDIYTSTLEEVRHQLVQLVEGAFA